MKSIYTKYSKNYHVNTVPFEDIYTITSEVPASSEVSIDIPIRFIENRDMINTFITTKHLDASTNVIKNAYLFSVANLNNNTLTIHNDSNSDKRLYITIR